MIRAIVASLVALVASTAVAQEAKKVTIAIYAPNAPFASGQDRFNYVNRLAQQIASVAGVQAEGKAFARAGDLEAAIKAKQVDFAVVDGVYLAERGVPFTVMAIATTGGETQPKWALFSSVGTDVKSLQGKRLSAAHSGSRDDDFIGNALFDGELQVKKFFAQKNEAPDLAAAVAAVTLKKADAVFAPESEGKGLKNVFEAGRIPNPAFCDVGSGLDGGVVAKIKQAVLAHGVQAALDGWKQSDAGPYRALASRMGGRVKRPVMTEPTVVKLEDLDVLVAPTLEPTQPDLRPQYWVPTP